MNQFVHDYWSRTELGRAMLASENVTESDLLFMIPNNVKRMHGLPATRTYGKRKSVIKRHRRRCIESFKMFDLISEIIDDLLVKEWNNSEFFGQFIDVKNIGFGDKDVNLWEKHF